MEAICLVALYGWCEIVTIKMVTDLLEKVHEIVKWVSYQRHKVTVKQMEFFKENRAKHFSHWRSTGRARMLRDEKNGRFIIPVDHVVYCQGVVLEAAPKKMKKEFGYDGVFHDVC